MKDALAISYNKIFVSRFQCPSQMCTKWEVSWNPAVSHHHYLKDWDCRHVHFRIRLHWFHHSSDILKKAIFVGYSARLKLYTLLLHNFLSSIFTSNPHISAKFFHFFLSDCSIKLVWEEVKLGITCDSKASKRLAHYWQRILNSQ